MWTIIRPLPATEASTDPSGIKTPPDSPGHPAVPTGPPILPGSWPEMLIDLETFVKLERGTEREVVDSNDQSNNPNYNGSKTLSIAGLSVDQVLVLEEETGTNEYISTFTGSKDRALASRGSSSSLAVQARGNSSGRSSPAPQGPVTRGRTQQKPGRAIGAVGLMNLGNTCYMNSALQCVRSVEELTKYFLTQEAKKEINPDNPLSYNGDVALSYGHLLEEIYKDPPPSSCHPRPFKNVIGRYAPAFSGYGQQDSQEFLGFLLDGLQEDLNRIKKKPYIEKPDSTDDMINNPAAIREMADKVWDITKKRDDSVIADLFTGMYQSTLVCPVCEKVSITFDPFNNLTLPLPIANVWTRNVRFYPLNDAPVELAVEIDKNSSIKSLKQYVSARVGVPVDQLFGAEEFRDKFFKFYDDWSSVSEEIQSSDVPTMHELEAPPTNLAPPKKPKKQQRYRSLLGGDDEQDETPSWEDPMAERMLVPVIHRFSPEDPNGNRKRYGRGKNGGEVPPPHFIILTPEEARNEDAIRRKVLERVATFTTWPEFSLADETDTTDTTDPEMVNTVSDVDSAGDAKVVAKSVEGEDDMVDVTMKDTAGGPNPAASAPLKPYPHLLKRFKNRRPKWLSPHKFLDPQFQNLFELKYFSDPGSLLPTGWNNVEDSQHPSLSSRQPKPVSDVEMKSPGAWEGSEESGSEDGQPPETSLITRMADESSEEDSDFPKVRNLPLANGQKKNQGKKRLQQQQRAALQRQEAETPEADEPAGFDGGPLLRLGEGLVVDWSEDAMDALFGEASPGGLRGMKTFADIPVLEDPTLAAKQKQRMMRKKHGITLDDCLAEFEKEEILSEQDTWYCPRCKEHRRASKKFDLWKTPDILVVHLKRFSSSGWRRDKIDILVDFPVEGLDLTERVVNKEDGKQEIYDLIAVDDHWGGLGGGHYTAFAKNFIDGEWYEYNDSSVTRQKDTARVISSAAYLLFYRRRSDTPLGGPRFQEICDRFDHRYDVNDDEDPDSGEGQRLGQGSSHRGSPSASTGAGLTLHHPQGSRGLDSMHGGFIGPLAIDAEPPSYQSNLVQRQVGEADDDDALVSELWPGQGALKTSIEGDEHDEAIDLPDYTPALPGMTSVISTNNWNWNNIITEKTGSEINGVDDDLASDVAQNDNTSISLDGDAFGDRTGEMEPMLMNDDLEPGTDYQLPDEPQRPESPPPPASGDDYMSEIAAQLWERRIHNVPADVEEDHASDKVAEIHVGDEKGDGEPGRTGQ